MRVEVLDHDYEKRRSCARVRTDSRVRGRGNVPGKLVRRRRPITCGLILLVKGSRRRSRRCRRVRNRRVIPRRALSGGDGVVSGHFPARAGGFVPSIPTGLASGRALSVALEHVFHSAEQSVAFRRRRLLRVHSHEVATQRQELGICSG